jgi:hypothetical protein
MSCRTAGDGPLWPALGVWAHLRDVKGPGQGHHRQMANVEGGREAGGGGGRYLPWALGVQGALAGWVSHHPPGERIVKATATTHEHLGHILWWLTAPSLL